MEEIKINYDENAIERLEKEIKGCENAFSKAIGNYLLDQLKADKTLEKCYYEQKLNLEDICKYVNDQAHEYLNGVSGAVEDKIVFGWVLHYVQDGWKKDAKSKVKIRNERKEKVLTVKEEKDLKEEAKKEFLAAEKKKLEEAEKKKEQKYQKAEKKRQEQGYMSLFDFEDDEE